jgi:hypothetical protein
MSTRTAPLAQLELFAVASPEDDDRRDDDGWPPCEVCGISSCGPHYDGSPDLCYRHFLSGHGPLRLAAVRAVHGTCNGCGVTRPAPDAISRRCWNCGADTGRPAGTVRVAVAGVL